MSKFDRSQESQQASRGTCAPAHSIPPAAGSAGPQTGLSVQRRLADRPRLCHQHRHFLQFLGKPHPPPGNSPLTLNVPRSSVTALLCV